MRKLVLVSLFVMSLLVVSNAQTPVKKDVPVAKKEITVPAKKMAKKKAIAATPASTPVAPVKPASPAKK